MPATVGAGIDYADLIERVYKDNDALAYAHNLWLVHAPSVFDERNRTSQCVRASDAGSCRLALWAELHDKLDIPESVRLISDRMEPGLVDGARTASLIAAGILRWYWPLTVTIEHVVESDNVPGHADAIVWAEPEAVEVIECKLTFWPKAIEPPHEPRRNKDGEIVGPGNRYWIHQACRYAIGANAPAFSVVVHAPATWNGPSRRSFAYATEDYRDETLREYERLAAALNEDPPEADAQEDWRCKSCRYSQCDRNVNPLRPTVDVIVDEIGVF